MYISVCVCIHNTGLTALHQRHYYLLFEFTPKAHTHRTLSALRRRFVRLRFVL